MPNKQSMSTAELVMIWTRQMAAKNRRGNTLCTNAAPLNFPNSARYAAAQTVATYQVKA